MGHTHVLSWQAAVMVTREHVQEEHSLSPAGKPDHVLEGWSQEGSWSLFHGNTCCDLQAPHRFVKHCASFKIAHQKRWVWMWCLICRFLLVPSPEPEHIKPLKWQGRCYARFAHWGAEACTLAELLLRNMAPLRQKNMLSFQRTYE